MTNDGGVDELLYEALGASQRLGFLGDRPIPEVVAHARLFVAALSSVTGTVVDLGSGGGVPGLVVAVDRPDLAVTLLDRRTKRTDFLSRMVRRLGIAERVTVIAADVDDAIRDGLTGFDAVVARGFGPPEFTLRTAARCVAPGGLVVISEPPLSEAPLSEAPLSEAPQDAAEDAPQADRWSSELLAELSLIRRPSDRRVARFRAMPDGHA